MAQLFGAPFAIISGGIGCLLAVTWIARRWPQLRNYNGDEPNWRKRRRARALPQPAGFPRSASGSPAPPAPDVLPPQLLHPRRVGWADFRAAPPGSPACLPGLRSAFPLPSAAARRRFSSAGTPVAAGFLASSTGLPCSCASALRFLPNFILAVRALEDRAGWLHPVRSPRSACPGRRSGSGRARRAGSCPGTRPAPPAGFPARGCPGGWSARPAAAGWRWSGELGQRQPPALAAGERRHLLEDISPLNRKRAR